MNKTQTLNWKPRGDGRYDALASRVVGGKYFIEWVESYYSENSCEWVEVRAYRVHYQARGGGRGNIHRVRIRAFEGAAALAEAHHAKLLELVRRHGSRIPQEAWGQFSREMSEWQQSRYTRGTP